jgi:N-acetyltransferase
MCHCCPVGRACRSVHFRPMWISPITLTGRFVRLEPLATAHARDLFRAADPELFRFTPQGPRQWSVEGFEETIREVNSLTDVVAFAVICTIPGHEDCARAIGRSTYMDIRPAHRGLEIGRTWIARRHQGTAVNPEMKLLMMQHAFQALSPPAIRVQFRTGASNLHSQRAIAKLGAVHEGVQRKDRILPDGTQRDSVTFSITDDEWPAARARLLARIEAGSAPHATPRAAAADPR